MHYLYDVFIYSNEVNIILNTMYYMENIHRFKITEYMDEKNVSWYVPK